MKKSFIEIVLDFIESNIDTPEVTSEFANSDVNYRLYTSTFVLQNPESEDVIIVCSCDHDFSKASLTVRYLSAKYNLEIIDPDLEGTAPRIFIV